jgi:hypothetical protein
MVLKQADPDRAAEPVVSRVVAKDVVGVGYLGPIPKFKAALYRMHSLRATRDRLVLFRAMRPDLWRGRRTANTVSSLSERTWTSPPCARATSRTRSAQETNSHSLFSFHRSFIPPFYLGLGSCEGVPQESASDLCISEPPVEMGFAPQRSSRVRPCLAVHEKAKRSFLVR